MLSSIIFYRLKCIDGYYNYVIDTHRYIIWIFYSEDSKWLVI